MLRKIHTVAVASGLFDEGDIKVRLRPQAGGLVGGRQSSFIHVFAHIMQGRSMGQRRRLSTAVVAALAALFPDLPRIAMNITEFERATYVNRSMIGFESWPSSIGGTHDTE
ncbi:5-carboxymethyl-2-hydroxymuconate isomerase [Wenzhouxiangella marina]|nr:5-carboxymethyl-2-hydroxymuconate isomerase [Wenzhouxiangella marina]